MNQIQEDLSKRIRFLEKELPAAVADKERVFRYQWDRGKAKFEEGALFHYRELKLGLPSCILHSRFLVPVTAPLIYPGFIPFLLLGLFLSFFQGVCFPIYGIPRVRRPMIWFLIEAGLTCPSAPGASFALLTLLRLRRCSAIQSAS